MKLIALHCTLAVLRSRAEQIAGLIEKLRDKLTRLQQLLRGLVAEYEAKRIELFEQELRVRNLDWCTKCNQTMYRGEGKLILCEWEAQFELHRVCSVCKKKAEDSIGPHLSVLSVEVIKGEWFVRRGEVFAKLDTAHYRLPPPCPLFMNAMMKQWELPPSISIIFSSDTLRFGE